MRAILPVLFQRVHERLHSNRVRAVIFLQVIDVKLNGMTFANVADGEEVPLTVVQCVVVEVEVKVVLALPDPFNFSQVA